MTDTPDTPDTTGTPDSTYMAERLREHLYADDAVRQLRHYLTDGAFASARFDTFGGRGDRKKVADRFTPEDLVATSILGRPVRGWGVIEILDTRRKRLSALLAALPRKRALHKASDDDLDALVQLEVELETVSGVGPLTRSRLLARKRPTMVSTAEPEVVQALTGRRTGDFDRPLRDALRAEGIVPRLKEIRAEADADHLSLVRVLDIVVWMRAGGANEARVPFDG